MSVLRRTLCRRRKRRRRRAAVVDFVAGDAA